MRIAFTADEGGFEADDYALVCGVVGGDRWLTFQRDAADSPDDWGVHLEFSGQADSDYGCVAVCRVGWSLLSVDLARQLGGLVGVTGFDVTLQLRPEQVSAVRAGLRQVFRGQLQLLAGEDAGGGFV